MTTLELQKPQQLITLEGERDELLRQIAIVPVENEEQKVQASDWLARVRSFLKAAEEKRKELVNPLNAQVKVINIAFANALITAKEAEDNLNKGISDFYVHQQELQRKEQARLDKLAEKRADKAEAKGEVSAVPEVIPAIAEQPEKTIVTEAGKVGMIKHRKFRIVDPKLVPFPDYWMIDEVKIGKMVRAGVPSIPGVQIWDEVGTAVRR